MLIKPKFGRFVITDTMLQHGMDATNKLIQPIKMAALNNQLYVAKYTRRNNIVYALGKDMIYDFCYHDLNMRQIIMKIIIWSITDSKEFWAAYNQYKNGSQN